MQRLTSQGQAVVDDLAQRHGFSRDAVTHMLFAVLNGNGGMAQFSHPEFGGSGQWMRGGMLMLSDMFNHTLKGRVDALCHEIAEILANQPGLLQTSGNFQSQSQSGGGQQHQDSGMSRGSSSLFVSDPADRWWPSELGVPNATGAQNDARYAYFADARRLAVRVGGNVRVYDTGDHRIGGFSQQQGSGGTITFTSQHGTVDLASLPVVSQDGHSFPSSSTAGKPAAATSPTKTQAADPAQADIFSAIERLGDLKDKELLTDEEFAAKKAELLKRL
ncbi:putative oligomerization/nucleic acid binding protein [Modicisalibacter xianhensis]|uniref:Putative oligomerization/nucleic acid binding protein n=1 Tax=Modicisalibacter xianhensis TaxID=442341 RepID=A0A4R8G4Q7_9GAMM|nr:SHOCT domain-containing protein [Halomonas xianhensis]TDX31619.1 putative oligomerization/nucleic acid binding protein [Halomonas xianhensis]